MGVIEDKIKAMGHSLPEPFKFPKPNRTGCVVVGSIIFASGPWPQHGRPRRQRPRARSARDLTVEEGYATARAVALSMLASLKQELGDLDRIKRVVRLFGMVNVAPGFDRMPEVIDGASDFFYELFGPQGRPACPHGGWHGRAAARHSGGDQRRVRAQGVIHLPIQSSGRDFIGLPQEAADGGVIELGAIRGFFGVLILSTTQTLHPGVRAGTVDEGQGVVDYVPRHSPVMSRRSETLTRFFYTHRSAGQEHRPVGQLPHDARRIIGHSLGSIRCLPRGVRCCRLLLATRALISLSRKGACHRCSGSALSTATRFQEPHMQSEVISCGQRVSAPGRCLGGMAVDRRGDKLPGFGGTCPEQDDHTHTHCAIRARRIRTTCLAGFWRLSSPPPSGRMSSLKIILGAAGNIGAAAPRARRTDGYTLGVLSGPIFINPNSRQSCL